MSTTDEAEARRLAARVAVAGAARDGLPGLRGLPPRRHRQHLDLRRRRAPSFERALPVLKILGQRILHTGEVGSASALKVLTNYLCTVHLAALAEALTVAKVAGLDLNTAYEAIRISSGNSFVHETESQVILNGSRDINFTMDLVIKDVGLFDALAQRTRCRWNCRRWCSTSSRMARAATARASSRPTSSAASRSPAAYACWERASRRRWSTMSPRWRATRSCRPGARPARRRARP